jgi:hypothetical protein
MGATRAFARGIGSILLIASLAALSSCGHPAVRQAELLRRDGDLLGARELLLELPPDDADALLALGRVEAGLADWHAVRGMERLAAGDLDGARLALEQALAIEPLHRAARRGHAALRARLVQRRAAEEVLAASIAARQWRIALEAGLLLPLEALARHAPGLSAERDRGAVLRALRDRHVARLAVEARDAHSRASIEGLEACVAEADHWLARALPGESAPDPALSALAAEWRSLLAEDRAAERHRREAWSELLGGDELHSWRLFRLASARRPGDREIAAEEGVLRRGARERVSEALRAAREECDLDAARFAVDLVDELGEGWPADAPATRSEVEGWLAGDLERRAIEAELRGRPGAALLAWLELADLAGDPGALERASRLADRIARTPHLRVRGVGEAARAGPPGSLEVILPLPHIEETVERTRVVEEVAAVRCGVESVPDPWREQDARRRRETLAAVLSLRDEWLAAHPLRAPLGMRRLQFHAGELRRLAERIDSIAPTSDRGIWRAREVEFPREERRIRVVQPILLTRDGTLVGERSLHAEGALSGSLAAPPGDFGSLPAGEAQRERLRLRLEAECRRRTPGALASLESDEVARLAAEAEARWRAGDRDAAIEAMVEVWLAAEEGLRERAAFILSAWTSLPAEPLELPPAP